MALLSDNNGPKIIRYDDGRPHFVVCAHPVRGDGLVDDFCGELIDVTDQPIRASMDCGKPENHRLQRQPGGGTEW